MTDRGVLITAGASGVGRAIGEAFANTGWRVWVTDIDAAALATCPKNWRADLADVSNEASMADLFCRVTRG